MELVDTIVVITVVTTADIMVDTVVDIPEFTIELVWDTQVWVVVTPPWEAVTIH